jgi:hypothetical protein
MALTAAARAHADLALSSDVVSRMDPCRPDMADNDDDAAAAAAVLSSHLYSLPVTIDPDLGALIERYERSVRARPQARLSIGEIASKYRGRRDWTESTTDSMRPTRASRSGSRTTEIEATRHVRIATQDLDPAHKRTTIQDRVDMKAGATNADLMPWLAQPRIPSCRAWDADSESSDFHCVPRTLPAPVPSPEPTDSTTGYRRPRLGRRFESKSEPSGSGSPGDADMDGAEAPVNVKENSDTGLRRVSAPPPKLDSAAAPVPGSVLKLCCSAEHGAPHLDQSPLQCKDTNVVVGPAQVGHGSTEYAKASDICSSKGGRKQKTQPQQRSTPPPSDKAQRGHVSQLALPVQSQGPRDEETATIPGHGSAKGKGGRSRKRKMPISAPGRGEEASCANTSLG